ncbi:MAG TPA: NYN domain-containing protein [Pirellulales bacterium]|jgi:predicted RNA-binding protein with PIN domain|nr:NYN domain-containing protein [Pirellulales bacterium]
MSLLIDGYNLLHASGILGRGVGPGSLERSRRALLNFLAESLVDSELARTTVVFDARDPPPFLPRSSQFRGMTVRFADPGTDADQIIEKLIQADSAPRRLTVVSSDHRLHRAARRRRAKPIDSDQWYAEVLRTRIERARAGPAALKPDELQSEVEVRFWLRQFGLDPNQELEAEKGLPNSNPFPPGYGEDLNEP